MVETGQCRIHVDQSRQRDGSTHVRRIREIGDEVKECEGKGCPMDLHLSPEEPYTRNVKESGGKWRRKEVLGLP